MRAGVVVVAVTTERDLAVLTWIGEQYAVPLDVLGEVLARTAPGDASVRAARFGSKVPRSATLASRDRLARKHAGRLQDLGLAERVRLLGEVWIAPTTAGLRFAGLPYDRWQPSGWSLAHIAAVARLRLHLQGTYPDARWEPERAIRSRWAGSGARVRLADGGLHWPDGAAFGIECELHVKRLDRYQSAVADCDPAWSAGVWWFTPIAQVDLLQQRLRDAGAGAQHEVAAIPEGVAL